MSPKIGVNFSSNFDIFWLVTFKGLKILTEDALTLWRKLAPDEFLGRHQHVLNLRDEELGKCIILIRTVWVTYIESEMETKRNFRDNNI